MILRKLIFFLCAALLAGCGGLAGEPRIVASLPPATPVPTDIGHPVNPPDIARGAAIFAQNCTQCHGADGKGNGQLVQSGQVSNPPDFTNPATVADQPPLNWYTTITNGNIDKLMPPWRDNLSEADRWDVAMYSYTLSLKADQIKRGHDLFTANCANCDLVAATNLVQSANLTNTKLVMAFPGLASKLTAEQGGDVGAYLRTLSLANADSIGVLAPMQTVEPPVSTPEVTAESTQQVIVGTVSGTVTNGTASGTVPPDTQVTLFIFDANLNQKQQTTKIKADGSFSFDNVTIDSTNSYVVTASYRNQIFASDIDRGAALITDMADGALNLPVKIYELTEDADVLQISGIVTQVNVIGEQMEVAQVFNIKNTSDRAYLTSNTTSDGRQISVVTTLPPGAVVVGFSNNQQRYVVDQANFTVLDTVPVVPGEDHTVQIVYLVPYKADAIIEQPMNYAVSGPVRLLLNPIHHPGDQRSTGTAGAGNARKYTISEFWR